jgi:hypothetical protein
VDAFLSGEGLPFAEILSAERIARIFTRHDCSFGLHGVYTTAITVWSFLSQVLRDGKEASCQAAVARVVSYCEGQGLDTPTADTGDYCRARAKLSVAALRELSCDVADQLEQEADESWLWKGKHHAKLIDGFTFTMPDTPENQVRYPQQKAQQPGVGLPIARAVAIVSLATACVMDLAMGPYQGKETGESALLRSMLGSLAAGDIAVMDRYYCSFMMIALLLAQGTHVCARKHHLRHSDFRRGRRLGKYDHLIVWTRPQRPKWMDEATYAQIPEQLVLREIRYHIIEPGRRTKTIDVITTLVDADEYTKEDIAQLYGFRWNSEEYHKALKTGCRTESRQLKAAGRLEALVALTGVVAVRLLQLKSLARTNPEIPAKRVVPRVWLAMLKLARKNLSRVHDLTVGQFYREVAKLGGFLGRKSDGEPGWITIWRGWEKLNMFVFVASKLKIQD